MGRSHRGVPSNARSLGGHAGHGTWKGNLASELHLLVATILLLGGLFAVGEVWLRRNHTPEIGFVRDVFFRALWSARADFHARS